MDENTNNAGLVLENPFHQMKRTATHKSLGQKSLAGSTDNKQACIIGSSHLILTVGELNYIIGYTFIVTVTPFQ